MADIRKEAPSISFQELEMRRLGFRRLRTDGDMVSYRHESGPLIVLRADEAVNEIHLREISDLTPLCYCLARRYNGACNIRCKNRYQIFSP